jgi:hypothetical protein
MADHTITVSNNLNLLGPGLPTLWGNSGATTMTWGTDFWGAGSEDGIQAVDKALAATLSLAAAYSALDEDHTVSNTLTFSSDITVATLGNGDWLYTFPGGGTNGDTRISTTYANPSASSPTWTDPSSPSTVWS